MIGTATAGSTTVRRYLVQGSNPFVPVVSDPADNKLVSRQLPALVPVGIDDTVIHSYFKYAKMSLYQLRFDAKLFLNLGCQTGSPISKSSLHTIRDFDTQALLLFVTI